MNRRDFVRAIGVSLAAVSIPIEFACADRMKFNQNVQYGSLFKVAGELNETNKKELIDSILKDINEFVPQQYVKDVEFIFIPRTAYTKHHYAGWKYPTANRRYPACGEHKLTNA